METIQRSFSELLLAECRTIFLNASIGLKYQTIKHTNEGFTIKMWIDDGQRSERFWLKQEKQQYTIQVSTESITVSTQVQIQYFPCPEILQT